jgi:hypothetical protein
MNGKGNSERADRSDSPDSHTAVPCYYSAVPNALFNPLAFPKVSETVITGLGRHFLCAKIESGRAGMKDVLGAFNVSYPAPWWKLARNRATAKRINNALLESGYIERVSANAGKTQIFRLTAKLRDAIKRNYSEIRADYQNRPRKRPCPKWLRTWPNEKRMGVTANDTRKGNRQRVTANDTRKGMAEQSGGVTANDTSRVTANDTSGDTTSDTRKETLRKEKENKKTAIVRGCAPDTPLPARETVQQALDCFRRNGRSESSIQTILDYVVQRCFQVAGRKVGAVLGFAYEDIRAAIKGLDSLNLDFFQIVEDCAEAAKTNPANLATVADFFTPAFEVEGTSRR